MATEMELVVDAGGDVRCIYDEALDLREIGKLQITRASHVEPDAEGYWWADMGASGGPVLGPYGSRSEALGAERELTPSPNPDPGLVRESSCPWWGWKGFSDEEATQCRADRGPASAG
jgi:hypothetical protein